MAIRIVTKIGNVLCADLGDGTECYFQYIANDLVEMNSSVIRVFKTHYPIGTAPKKMDDIVKDEVHFYAHTVLRAGIAEGAWRKVGRSNDIGGDEVKKVWWGFCHRTKHTPDIYEYYNSDDDFKIKIPGKFEVVDPLTNWMIWQIGMEDIIEIGVLPEKYHDILELGGVYPYDKIIERMRRGYYKGTSWVYDVIPRRPLPYYNSFLKVKNSDNTMYLHFIGDSIERQIIVSSGRKARYSCDKNDGYGPPLYKSKFHQRNWAYEEFITKEEFEAEWVN